MRIAMGLSMAAIVVGAAVYAFSPRHTPPLAATRLVMERTQINTLVRAGRSLVAAGELGVIARSDDEGKTWQAVPVEPQRHALLNQIVFIDDKTGMAVGHEGLILRTDDGGRHWKELAFDKERGEPLMSIARLPSGTWLAVGAFGRALSSTDDGTTWQRIELAGAEDKHLNRIVATADRQHWLIVGERGLVLASDDAGVTWRTVPAFYNGSLYGAHALPDGGWLAYGMRGHAYRSDPRAQAWVKSEVPVPILMLGDATAPDGSLLLVGQGGVVLRSTDGGSRFAIVRAGGRAALTDIQLLADGHWLLASDGGLRNHDPAAAPAAAGSAARPPAAAPAGAAGASAPPAASAPGART